MVDHLFSDASLAALYDLFSPPEQRDDLAFYLGLVMSSGAVLDVGCGTGALLHQAREAGHRGRLCGLDPGVGMLERARRRPDIEWIHGDLAGVCFDREFDLVVMTGHAFQVLVEDEEIHAGLVAVRRALRQSGRFAFETRNPRAREWERWTPENAAEIVDATGASVRMERRVETPVEGDVVRFSHTFISPTWDRPEVSRSTLKFLDTDALHAFLVAADLDIEEQYGDWTRVPLTETSPEIITVARRAPLTDEGSSPHGSGAPASFRRAPRQAERLAGNGDALVRLIVGWGHSRAESGRSNQWVASRWKG